MSNYNSTLQSNNTDLQAILSTINELPNAGGEQATPVISINTSGLITATAGTKTSTYQLAFQPAKTIIPDVVNQRAVSSGYYTGGNIIVAGDSNLIPDNIKSGVSIFGVSGNYAGSGGDTSIEDGLINRTISGTYTNDRVTKIGGYAFYDCSSLTAANFPVVTSIEGSAFFRCYSLTSVNFPAVKAIGSSAFFYCSSLTTVNFPTATTIGINAFDHCKMLTTLNFPAAVFIGSSAFTNCKGLATASFPAATTINYHAFYYCTSLTTLNFPAATLIGSSAFYACSKLSAIYLGANAVCRLSNSTAFSLTGIWHNKGSIFVPASLVNSYKTATNWTYFSDRIYSM